MATIQDLFTGGYDSTLWSVSKTNANTTVLGVNDQLEIANTDSVGGYDGLTSKIAYDFTAVALANIVSVRVDRRAEFYLIPTNPQNTDPTTASDYLRFYYTGGDLRVEHKVAGVSTDNYLIGWATNDVFELSFPSTGNEVRALVNGIERSSFATFGFSRTCYIALLAYTDTALQEVHFDTFNATYQASGATITGQPVQVVPAGTGYQITGSGFGTTFNTATLVMNGTTPVTALIDSALSDDTTITFDMPSVIDSLYDTTGFTFTFIADDATTDDSAAVPYQPIATNSYVVTTTPDLTVNSFFYNYSGDAPTSGMNIVGTTLTSVTGKTVTYNSDGTWSLSAPVTVDETVQVFFISSDGTVGSTMTYTFFVGGGGGFVKGAGGLISSFGKLGLR